MKALPSDNLRILREKYIRALSDAKDETGSSAKGEKELADDLFALDLTMYSKSFSFTSLVYNLSLIHIYGFPHIKCRSAQ